MITDAEFEHNYFVVTDFIASQAITFPLDDHADGKRIVIWGTGGNFTKNYMEWLDYRHNNFDFIGFVDSDPNKQGTIFRGRQIYAPEYLLELRPDCIIIASYALREIYGLLRKMGYSGLIAAPIFPGLLRIEHDPLENSRELRDKAAIMVNIIQENMNIFSSLPDANLALNTLEYSLQREWLYSFPQVVAMPLTDICNARCIFCHCRTDKRKYYASIADIKYLDWLKYAKDIHLAGGLGDALVSSNFIPLLEFIANSYPAAALTMLSNGIGLNEENIIHIAKHITTLQISLNAADERTWQILMRPKKGSHENIVRMIGKLSKYKRQSGNRLQQIQISAVISDVNIESMELIVKKAWEAGADSIVFIGYINSDVYPDRQELSKLSSCYYYKNIYNEQVVKSHDLARKYGISISFMPNFIFNLKGVPFTTSPYEKNASYLCSYPWQQINFINNSTPYTKNRAVFCSSQFNVALPWSFEKLTEDYFVNHIWNGATARYIRRSLSREAENNPFCRICRSTEICNPLYSELISETNRRVLPAMAHQDQEATYDSMEAFAGQIVPILEYTQKRIAARSKIYNCVLFPLSSEPAESFEHILKNSENILLEQNGTSLLKESRLYLEGLLEYPEMILDQALLSNAEAACAAGKLYARSGMEIFAFTRLLYTRFHARFIHLTRDGRKSVALMRDWHARHSGRLYREGKMQPKLSEKAREAIDRLTVEKDMFNVSLPRPLPATPDYILWQSMTHHEMLCWHWNFVHSYIIEQYAGMSDNNVVRLDLSHPELESELRRVINFIGFKIDDGHIQNFLVNETNKSEYMHWEAWSDEEQEQFWKICGHTMHCLGYKEE